MNINHLFNKAVFITALLLTTTTILNAKYVLSTDNLIHENAIQKIEEIGTELNKKLNISLYLYANDTINGKTMIEYREEIRKKHNNSYIILLFAQKEQKVDIITSEDLVNKFDKEEVLDPFSGTIIPLLITKPKKDAIDDRASAAMLNGYADIAERVANNSKIELESSIGNTNRDIINIARIIFYTAIVIILFLYFRKKFARKK